jgi:hypothetical protein
VCDESHAFSKAVLKALVFRLLCTGQYFSDSPGFSGKIPSH